MIFMRGTVARFVTAATMKAMEEARVDDSQRDRLEAQQMQAYELSLPKWNVARAMDACSGHGTTIEEITQRGPGGTLKKKRTVVLWRAAIFLDMRNTGMSYPEIADAFGLQHSTVIAALKRKGTHAS